MVKEEGVVTASHNGLVEVEVVRTSSCQACQAKAACGHHAIAKVTASNNVNLLAQDDLSCEVGEKVIVGVPESTLLTASFFMYLAPLLSLIFATVIAETLFNQPTITAFSTFSGLAFGLFIARRVSNKQQGNANFQPRVLERKVPHPHFDNVSSIKII